jgi:RNA polymerase sigma-70 factor (ECF subfamily)
LGRIAVFVTDANDAQAELCKVRAMIGPEARGAWCELEARLRPYVARRVRGPADVDDVVQEVFVRLQRGLSGLRDGERFGGWVYRIAEHAVADHLRLCARHPLAASSDAAIENEIADVSEAEPTLEAELAECVALFVSRLPSPYREAITLTELQGLTQKDGAQMLGLSLSGMKSRVQRGREQIRRMFEECCEISTDARGHVVDCMPRALEEIPADCRAVAECWSNRRPT